MFVVGDVGIISTISAQERLEEIMDKSTNAAVSFADNETQSRAMQVMCLLCDAQPGQHCVQPGRNTPLVDAFHPHRIELANRLIPYMPEEITDNMDPSTKAVIIYYAFIMLANSVAENSMKVLGREHTTEEVQKCFARMAVRELRTAKLID